MSTITWEGGASGDWSAGYDWSGGVAPQAGDTVVIGGGAVVTIDTPGVAALNITVDATSTLDLKSTLTLGGTLYGGELILAGTLVGGTLDAPLNAREGSVLDGVDVLNDLPLAYVAITPATAQATGSLPIFSAGDLTLDPGTYDGAFLLSDAYISPPVFDTVGDITFAPTATVTIDGPVGTVFEGTGTVTNQGGIGLGGDTNPVSYPYGNAVDISGDGFVNAGTLTLAPNAGTFEPVPTGLDVSEILFANSGLLSDPAGTISFDAVPQGGLAVGGDTLGNSGMITAAQVVAGGNVSDFVNTGSIVAGSIVFDNAVTLAQLGGLSGVVTIGGTLDLQGGSLDAGAFGAGFTVTGTVENGTLTATGGQLTLIGATLDNVAILPGGDVVVAGPITLIDPPAGATLDGTTTDIIAVGAAALITLAVNTTSVNASGSLILTGGQATLTGTGISLVGTSGFANSLIGGVSIDMAAGTLDIATPMTGSYSITLGMGTALIANGETLAAGGNITLDAGVSITTDAIDGVTLDGLQAGDLIDLTGLSSAGTVTPSAQIVGGTLEITAASGQTASIALVNPPPDATLLVLNDGQGGSLIADPPLPPLTATTNFFGTPGTYYGSYALDGGTLSQSGAIAVEGTYAVDLLDGAVWQISSLSIGRDYSETQAGGAALTINGRGPTSGTLIVSGTLGLGDIADPRAEDPGGIGDLTLNDSSVRAASMSLENSDVTLDASSSIVVGDGAAVNGALTVAPGATLDSDGGNITGNLIDNGTVDDFNIRVSGNFALTGTLDAGTMVAGSLSLFDGSVLSVNQGAILLGVGTLESGALVIAANATLSVDLGTIGGNVIDNGSIDILSPDGFNLGTLSVFGDMTVDSAPSTYVNGVLDISGALSVAIGTLLNMSSLTAGTLSGGGTVMLGATDTIDAITGTPTIDAAYIGTLRLDGTDLSGLTVNSIGFDAPTSSATIDLPRVTYSLSFGENVQSLTIAGAVFNAANIGKPTGEPELFTSNDGTGGTLVYAEIPCFAAGTRILAEHGESLVEALLPGQRVRTASGRLAPITWIGRTTVNLSRHPDPARAAPIRIAADAFAPGVPCRDLYLSRDHSVFLDGALIPVWRLANGASIARDDTWRSVTYYHVELDRHDILLAEGLASESYLDTGNRGLFANASGVRPLHPTFPDPGADALRIWAERAAAPLLLDGPVVAAHRARLLARAKTLGWERSDDAALSCFANGVALPIYRDEDGWRARIPRHVTSLRLRSRSFIQAERGRDSGDLRRLGLAVAALLLDGQILPPDCLGAGWHAPDTIDTPWRWTDGNAHVALPSRAGAARLDIQLAYRERYLTRRAVTAQGGALMVSR